MARRKRKRAHYRKAYKKRYQRKQKQQAEEQAVGAIIVLLVIAWVSYKFIGVLELQWIPWLIGVLAVGGLVLFVLITALCRKISTVWRYLRSEREQMDWFMAAEKVKHIQAMNDYEAEQYIIKLFQTLGYQATGTVRGPDGGIDGHLQKGPHQYLLQVKRYKDTNKVTVKEVREFAGVCAAKRNISGGYFVTTSSLTEAAATFADEAGLFVWDKQVLAEYIDRSKSN